MYVCKHVHVGLRMLLTHFFSAFNIYFILYYSWPSLLLFNFTKPTNLLYENERKDYAESDRFESESTSDCFISNGVTHTMTAILLENCFIWFE